MSVVITTLTPADLDDVLAASPRLSSPAAGQQLPTGWVARDDAGTLVGALVDQPGRPGDARAGEWFASSARTLTDLYTAAAAVWLAAGIPTHRVVLPHADPLEPVLVDLGFGHQQAFGSAPLTLLRSRAEDGAAGVHVRSATRQDLPELTDLVPLVSRHQGGSPVFAPRSPEFFDQLPASIEEFVEEPALQALLAVDGSTAVGFALLEHDGAELEVVLAGTRPDERGRGVARALVAAATAWGETRGAVRVVADWRTTNPVAARFWPSVGLTVDAYRWARTIDPTPA